MTPEDAKPSSADECKPVTGGAARRGRLVWPLKLALLMVLAMAVGGLAAANWRPRPFSLVFTIADIRVGIVILAAVGVGFLLAIVFLWSAFSRE